MKKLAVFLVCLSLFLCCIPVAAATEPTVSLSFEKKEISVGEEVDLLLGLSSDVTHFSANIQYNNYFSYTSDGLGFDRVQVEYTLNFTPGSEPHVISCYATATGNASVTLTKITLTTQSGTVSYPNITASIIVNPEYTYIYTKEDLNKVRNNLDGAYKLMNDIVFTDADFSKNGAFYNDGFGWIPIGAVVKTPFTGEFNGNGFSIKGLKINKAYYNYCGLFGVNKGKIRNLRIENAYIDGRIGINMSVSASAPQVISGGIDYEDKEVWTPPDDSITEDSLNSYDRTGVSTANLGTVCGFNLGTVKEVYCSGVVIGNSATGGIAGRNNASIYECATNTEVVSESIAGGIAGVGGSYSKIYDVTTDGGVTGVMAGGILGSASGSVSRAYVLSEIISDDVFASFGKDDGVTAAEVYAFGSFESDGKTVIKDLTELSALRFTQGNWTYTSVKPYPTALADLVETVIPGDINSDSAVNGTDLALLKLYLAGASKIDEAAGDYNCDGSCNGTDLALLKLYLAGAV